MGTRKGRERQEELWVAYADIAAGPGHPFYVRLNEVLDGAGFDAFVEQLCARFYAEKLGRPGLTPGIYYQRENPRLCRGGSSSLTFTGIVPGL